MLPLIELTGQFSSLRVMNPTITGFIADTIIEINEVKIMVNPLTMLVRFL